MASTLPTPPDCGCTAPDNGCCNDDCVTVTIAGGGFGITTHGVGDLNVLGIIPTDTTVWQFGLEHAGTIDGPVINTRVWNPAEQEWQ